ncbi:MAG: hypothetical protein E7395_01640 [Ruminococcaceae bacterium]|nr:hypothetical protein [Oscillospiraceae bacterium]
MTKIETKYQFRERLLKVHEPDIRNVSRKANDNEFELKDIVHIKIPQDAGVVLTTAGEDFADYLKTSMKIGAGITFGDDAEICIDLAENCGVQLDEYATYKGFMINTDKDGIKIVAFDERGAAQALYYIEDLMTFAKAPVMEYGIIKKKPVFSPQMVHSGYGLDEYPDEYLARVAHEGRDAILVFTKDINQTSFGYLNFNDLIQRAAKYGLDVYAYSKLLSEKSPEDPEAEAYYENTYGRLFRECPGLKGVTLVGESVEFPSKDPHVSKGRYFETTVDGIPTGKLSSGWYPCYDYPIWLNFIKKIIRKYRPDADIVFWTYNWGSQPEDIRVKLIESLPDDISVQATFEQAEHIPYANGAKGRCCDYTLSFEGPGKYFKSEAVAAKKNGIPLYSMTNSGGLTWDFGVVPYLPMPYQWMKRYENMLKAHDEWGLSGIMECHHYGFTPSFISKFGKHAFLEPREPMEVILKKVLVSEFGETNYDKVNEALKCYSEAIRYYIPSDSDQYGAFRVGPSYPFNMSVGKALPQPLGCMIPADPDAYFGNRIIEMTYRNVCDHRISPVGLRIGEEIKSLEKMLGLMEKGTALLSDLPDANAKTDELKNLGHFMTNCVKTGINAKKWFMLICQMNVTTTKEAMSEVYDNMEALLEEELVNVNDTIPLVEKDSRLGWEPSMLYMTDKWHLEWKIRQVRYVIDTEIGKYRKALEL